MKTKSGHNLYFSNLGGKDYHIFINIDGDPECNFRYIYKTFPTKEKADSAVKTMVRKLDAGHSANMNKYWEFAL